MTPPLALTWFNNLPFDEILKRAAVLPSRSAIFWELMVVDGDGVVHEEGKALSRLHAVANAPIFSYTDAFFGQEIVGGPHVPVLEYGQRVAEVAIRILGGESPSSIKAEPVGFGPPKFDWREMKRWGIGESSLPPGSAVHFRETTLWERNREVVLFVFAVLLFQAFLIGWLIYEHRRRHLAEIHSRNSLAELTYMNRVASAGQLSASIAHEVNQPLTGIVARASAGINWLRREQPDIPKAQAALQHIVEAAERASGIISSVRAMFRKETSSTTRVDLNDIVRAVIKIVRIDLRVADIDVVLQLKEDLPPVMGDKVQLQQVVLNLVLNAIEAMRSGPERVLRIQSDQVKPGSVRVSVSDTGPGVDASSLDQIFEPMFTTKSRGMGMGLAICRSIIETHDGRIWVSPAPGGGSIFQVELPAREPAQAEMQGELHH